MNGFWYDTKSEMNKGTTEIGYATELTGLEDMDELRQKVDAGEAYKVKVYRPLNKLNIKLVNGDTKRYTATGEQVSGMRRAGRKFLSQNESEQPPMPSETDNPDEMFGIYAEYALKHGRVNGIEVEDVDWDNLLDKQDLDKDFPELED
jgi:hypothetical protein